MEKNYSSPKMEYMMLFASDVIAVSTLITGVDNDTNGKFGGIHELDL